MAKKPAARPSKEIKLVKDLAGVLNESGLTAIEYEIGDLKIKVAKENSGVVYASAPAAPMAVDAAQTPAPAPAVETPAPTNKADASAHPGAVKSPMVGTAYTRPSPDADLFVNIGDNVKEGETILLVEAMKTFNPITAPKSGKIQDILVEDAQPVEFGEVLFIIA